MSEVFSLARAGAGPGRVGTGAGDDGLEGVGAATVWIGKVCAAGEDAVTGIWAAEDMALLRIWSGSNESCIFAFGHGSSQARQKMNNGSISGTERRGQSQYSRKAGQSEYPSKDPV